MVLKLNKIRTIIIKYIKYEINILILRNIELLNGNLNKNKKQLSINEIQK